MLEEHIVRSNQAVNFSHAKSLSVVQFPVPLLHAKMLCFRKYSLASALFNKYNAASS